MARACSSVIVSLACAASSDVVAAMVCWPPSTAATFVS